MTEKRTTRQFMDDFVCLNLIVVISALQSAAQEDLERIKALLSSPLGEELMEEMALGDFGRDLVDKIIDQVNFRVAEFEALFPDSE